MNTSAIGLEHHQASPSQRARIAGFFFLLTFISGIIASIAGRTLGERAPVVNLIGDVCYAIVALLLYRLFTPVSTKLSVLATVAGLAGCAVGISRLLGFSGFPIHNLVFFGVQCLVIGYLIIKSTFLPRFIGVLMMLAGAAWIVYLSPELARSYVPYILFPGMIGQGLLMLWLLIKGVDDERWMEQQNTSN